MAADTEEEQKELRGEVLLLKEDAPVAGSSGFLCCGGGSSSHTQSARKSWVVHSAWLRSPKHSGYGQFRVPPQQSHRYASITLQGSSDGAPLDEYFAVFSYQPFSFPQSSNEDALSADRRPLCVFTADGSSVVLAMDNEDERGLWDSFIRSHLPQERQDEQPERLDDSALTQDPFSEAQRKEIEMCLRTALKNESIDESDLMRIQSLSDKVRSQLVSFLKSTAIGDHRTAAAVATSVSGSGDAGSDRVKEEEVLPAMFDSVSTSLEASSVIPSPTSVSSNRVRTRIEYACALDDLLSARLVSGKCFISVFGSWNDWKQGNQLIFQGNMKVVSAAQKAGSAPLSESETTTSSSSSEAGDSGWECSVFTTFIDLPMGSHLLRFKVTPVSIGVSPSPPALDSGGKEMMSVPSTSIMADEKESVTDPSEDGSFWVLSKEYKKTLDNGMEVNQIDVPLTGIFAESIRSRTHVRRASQALLRGMRSMSAPPEPLATLSRSEEKGTDSPLKSPSMDKSKFQKRASLVKQMKKLVETDGTAVMMDSDGLRKPQLVPQVSAIKEGEDGSERAIDGTDGEEDPETQTAERKEEEVISVEDEETDTGKSSDERFARFDLFLDSFDFEDMDRDTLRKLDIGVQKLLTDQYFKRELTLSSALSSASSSNSEESYAEILKDTTVSGRSPSEWCESLKSMAAKCGVTVTTVSDDTLRNIVDLFRQLIVDIRGSKIDFVAELCEFGTLDSVNYISQAVLKSVSGDASKPASVAISKDGSKLCLQIVSLQMDIVRAVLATPEDIGFEILCDTPDTVGHIVSVIAVDKNEQLPFATKTKALNLLSMLTLWELDTFEQTLALLQQYAAVNTPEEVFEAVASPRHGAVDSGKLFGFGGGDSSGIVSLPESEIAAAVESSAASGDIDSDGDDGSMWAVFLIMCLKRAPKKEWDYKLGVLKLLNAIMNSQFLDVDDRMFVVEQIRLSGFYEAVTSMKRDAMTTQLSSLESRVIKESQKCFYATLQSLLVMFDIQSDTSTEESLFPISKLNRVYHWKTEDIHAFFTRTWDGTEDSIPQLKKFLHFCTEYHIKGADLSGINGFVLTKFARLTDKEAAKRILHICSCLSSSSSFQKA